MAAVTTTVAMPHSGTSPRLAMTPPKTAAVSPGITKPIKTASSANTRHATSVKASAGLIFRRLSTTPFTAVPLSRQSQATGRQSNAGSVSAGPRRPNGRKVTPRWSLPLLGRAAAGEVRGVGGSAHQQGRAEHVCAHEQRGDAVVVLREADDGLQHGDAQKQEHGGAERTRDAAPEHEEHAEQGAGGHEVGRNGVDVRDQIPVQVVARRVRVTRMRARAGHDDAEADG